MDSRRILPPQRNRKKGLLVLNLLPGTGFLLAVLSPENVNVAIHSVGAVLAFFPGAIVMLLAFRTIQTQFRYFSLFFGLVSFVGIIFEFGGYYSPLVQQTLRPGGWERVIVYPILIWLVGYRNYLLTMSTGARLQSSPRGPSLHNSFKRALRPKSIPVCETQREFSTKDV